MSVASSSSASATGVPRLGGVRCYWALISPRFPTPANPYQKLELDFVHPDPVLGVHLARQQMSLMGRGLIEFIHPAEREQARRDLASAVASDDLQGSVTRVRFARLSRIRAILGCPPEDLDIAYDASMFVEDDEYLILDIVLNWVADGLLLAFFHAIKDKDPARNNDPMHRHEEWSNFCGTANMPEEVSLLAASGPRAAADPTQQIHALHLNISSTVLPPTRTRFPPTRVFQLHTTATSPTRPGSLIFSWPPPRPPNLPAQVDGLYDAEEYSDLMRGVDMDPSQLASGPGEPRTSCTTRFGARHSITSEHVYRQVTSVFIPYGSLIFACFQTTRLYEIPPPSPDMFNLVTPQQNWQQQDYKNANRQPKRPREEYELSYAPEPASAYVPEPAYVPETAYIPDPASTFVPELSPLYPTPSPGTARSQKSPTESVGLNNGSRPLVRPPGDVECCKACGTRESPEWRKSEEGVKDLCNACGLRLARAQAKKEGRHKPRRKKERAE
ncbi:hypothetical protein P7C73_g1812, partial [Tremellales sp. Uapishka_1]